MEITKPFQRWEDSSFKMVDVGIKPPTFRRAQAQGEILMSRAAFLCVKNSNHPKGNVLALAETAGMICVKKTAEFIPLCHPLSLDQIRFSFHLNDVAPLITVFCEVSAIAKTGVEMEALSGVNGALLSIYDCSKAVDPVLTIQNIKLNIKEGGKSGIWIHPEYSVVIEKEKEEEKLILDGIHSVVITVSDRVSAKKMEDLSGPEIVSFLKNSGSLVSAVIQVKDEKSEIQAAVWRCIREHQARLVILTGGTGLGPRDITPEAIEDISDRIIPGIGECLRNEGSKQTPFAWLSRSVGVLIGSSLVITLPGSQNAVRQCLQTLSPFIAHSLQMTGGGNHD